MSIGTRTTLTILILILLPAMFCAVLHSPARIQSSTLPLRVAWQYTSQAQRAGGTRGIPEYVGERVYFSSGDHLYVLDALTGEELWNHNAQGFISQFQANDHLVSLLAQTGWVNDTLMVLNADTGELLWEQEGFFLSFCWGDDKLFAALEGHIRAYDVGTGEELWDNQTAAESHWGLHLLHQDDLLYVEGRRLRVLNASTGKMIQEFDVQTAPGQTSIDHGVLYTADDDSQMLTAIDGQTGSVIWSNRYWPARDLSDSVPTFVDSVLYLPDKDWNLLAVDSSDGSLLWQYSESSTVEILSNIAVCDGVVYTIFADNTLRGLDARTGQEIGRLQAAGIDNPSELGHVVGTAKVSCKDDLLLLTFDSVTLFALRPQ